MSDPTPGHVCGGEDHGSKGYIHPSVQCSAVYNSQDMEATQMYIIEERIVKMWYIHRMKYLTIKKNETSFATTWIDEIILSKVC